MNTDGEVWMVGTLSLSSWKVIDSRTQITQSKWKNISYSFQCSSILTSLVEVVKEKDNLLGWKFIEPQRIVLTYLFTLCLYYNFTKAILDFVVK